MVETKAAEFPAAARTRFALMLKTGVARSMARNAECQSHLKKDQKMNSRKTITVVFVLVLLIIAAVAVSQGQSNQSSNSPEVQKVVLARLAEIQSAAQDLNPDKVFSFVMENDKGSLAQNGKLFLTRKEALESTRQGFQRLQKVNYQFDQQHVTLLSPTVAVAVGEGRSSATLDDGKTLETHFVQSVIFILTNGDWMVFHSHRSFAPAK